MSIFSKPLSALYGKDQKESLEIDISAKDETKIQSPAKGEIGPKIPLQPRQDLNSNSLFEQGFVAGQKEILSRVKEQRLESKSRNAQFVDLTSEIITSIKELKETLITEFEAICKQDIPKLTVDVLRKLEQNEPLQFRSMVSSFMQSMAMEDIAIHCSPQVFDTLSGGSENKFDPILILEDQYEGHRMEIKFA